MALVVGAGLPQIVVEVTKDVGSVATVSVALEEFTVTGARPEMTFICNPGAALATGLALGQPYCVANDVVVVPFINPTAGGVNPASTTYKFIGF